MKKVKNISMVMAAAIAGTVLFSNCTKEDEVILPEYGKVMVVHASPDAPAVDVEVDDKKVNTTGIGFKTATAYLDVVAGSRKFDINAAGSLVSVISTTQSIAAKKNYTVWAVNKLSSIELVTTPDDLTAPASGNAHVRFVHLSPDAPAVDIRVKDNAAIGNNVFGNVAFKGLVGFKPLPAATYNLEVYVAGTATKVLDLPNITLANGKIYTVYARGFVTGLDAGIIANN
jgi:hypothetical protein